MTTLKSKNCFILLKQRKYLICYLIVLCFLVFFNQYGYSQSPSIEEIKRPGSVWYWGEGTSAERDEAREKALKELSTNIAVNVTSNFQNIIEETNSNVHEFMESVTKTYTSASFTYLQHQTETDIMGNHIFLYYIHKDEMERQFRERKKFIIDIYNVGNDAIRTSNVSRALQHYYYCLILINSVPDINLDYEGENLRVVIPRRIQDILDNVRFVYDGDIRESESLRTVKIRLEYDGKPVDLLDMVYIERGIEHRSQARDGLASFVLTGASVTYNDLDLEIEYRYASERDCFPLVDQLWQGVKKPSFNNRRKISFSRVHTSQLRLPARSLLDDFDILLKKETHCPFQREIKEEIITFLSIIKSNDLNKIREAYRHDQFLQNKITEIIRHNRPQLIDNQFQIDINETWDGWEVRSIPVACNYPSKSLRATEYLVLDFDKNGKFVDISFNVFDELFQTYVNDERASAKEISQRHVIVKFLEKYRTAFLNRDLVTLEKIFADEAVIIVGRVLETANTDKRHDLQREFQQVEYFRLSKQDYLERQKTIFSLNRDIHLGFNNFKILKKNRDTDIFGISMRQQYVSSIYSDEGYLFLLIDFMDKDPTIYVRCWQPREWSEEQLINMSDFRILE